MKTIHLIRHAKSDWTNSVLEDKERPLAERGKSNSLVLRNLLNERNVFLDTGFVSNSHRTLETYRMLAEYREIVKKLIITSKAYETSYSELLNLLQSTNQYHNSVLLLGHNPGLEDLANYLVLGKQSSHGLFAKFPTCSYLVLHANVEKWEDLSANTCGIHFFWIPYKVSDSVK